jgi:hypothetical protein
MSDPRPQELSADWLDHLVLDMAELEALTARLEQSLGAIGPTGAAKGAVSVQILDVLVRVSETAGALHDMASGRLRSLAAAMAAASGNDEPTAAPGRQSIQSTAHAGEPVSRRRISMSVR